MCHGSGYHGSAAGATTSRQRSTFDLTLPYIRQYMTIWFPGTIFVVVPMVGNNCIRATGDAVARRGSRTTRYGAAAGG